MIESLGFDYARVAFVAFKLLSLDDKGCGRNWKTSRRYLPRTLYQMVREIIDISVTRMVRMTNTCLRGMTEGKCNNSNQPLHNLTFYLVN